MMSRDDWANRVLKIAFINEDAPKGKPYKFRNFKHVSGDVTAQQILQFGHAVSKLTPNLSDGDLLLNVYDQFQFSPMDYEDDDNATA